MIGFGELVVIYLFIFSFCWYLVVLDFGSGVRIVVLVFVRWGDGYWIFGRG